MMMTQISTKIEMTMTKLLAIIQITKMVTILRNMMTIKTTTITMAVRK